MRTANTWLRRLGFEHSKYKKGLYYDGHERDDVVADRLLYLREKDALDKKFLYKMPTQAEIEHWKTLPPHLRPWIELVHDKSAINANDGQNGQWVLKGHDPKTRSKSLGKGIMVSAFLSEVLGILEIRDAENNLIKSSTSYLEFGKKNYWTSAKCLHVFIFCSLFCCL